MQAAPRIRMGEVFQLYTKEVILACSYCSEEFEYFTEFTLHAQEHLQQLWQQSTVIIEDICENDSLSTEYRPDKSSEQQNFAVVTALNGDFGIKNENIDEDNESEAADMDFWSEDPFESEELPNDEPIKPEALPSRKLIKPEAPSNDEPIQAEALPYHKPIEAGTLPKDEPIEMTVKPENTVESGLSSADRYDKLIQEYQASTPTTRSLRMLEKLRSRMTPMTVADRPETRMLANFFVNPSKIAKLDANDKRKVCPICDKNISCMTALRYHIFTHSSMPTFDCPMCDVAINNPSDIWRHLRSHAKFRIECTLCKTKCNDLHTLKSHMKRMHLKFAYCTICNKQFTQTSGYNKHMKRLHSKNVGRKRGAGSNANKIDCFTRPTPSSWQCYLCRKEYSTRKTTNRHMRNHIQQPVLCPICGKQFKAGPRFRRHLSTHNNVRSHACDLCDKAYTARVYLLEHRKKKHNLFVGASCRLCLAQFVRRSDLTDHMRAAHSTEQKPFR